MKRPTFGIATDGAHSMNERSTCYRAVDLSSGQELFFESVGNWTNDIGAFLGIVAAVKYILEHTDAPRIIYSGSSTAIAWYHNRRTASSRHCPALLKAEIFLKLRDSRGDNIEVRHWDNRLWGEIPVDFENKK